jgi:bifunctional lysine-specific demethylase and histidyl-hydroxylase NO66
VHLHEGDPERLIDLFSLDDADHLLTSTAIRTPQVRLARDGAVLAESAYTRGGSLAGKPLTGLVDPVKLMRLHDEGATIVLRGLQRYWTPVSDLVAELELELGHPCQANAYLTPPGSQGFAVHSDSHDVFVFQTAGSKQWEVHGADGPEDVLLEPGLSMYLPTGTPHAARAQETVSLHVTVGINQLTWRGLVERTLAQVVAEVPAEHLPAGYLDDPARLTGPLAERLEALAEAVRRIDADAAVETEIRRFLTSRPPRLSGGMTDVLALRGGIDDDTRLRRRPGHPCLLLDEDERVVVLLGDRSLTVPGWLRPALEEIRARPSFTVGDLADLLDPQSRKVLCRRLVREGLLEAVS